MFAQQFIVNAVLSYLFEIAQLCYIAILPPIYR